MKAKCNGRRRREAADASCRAGSGFGTAELLTTIGLTAVLLGLAIPSYRDAVERRQVSQAAEMVAAFINTAQSESIKRNRPVAVSWALDDDGTWCVGATVGQAACDCTATDPSAPEFCALDDVHWILRDSDVSAQDLVGAVTGDGAYVFDPVRGRFADSADSMTLDLGAANGTYQLRLHVVSTGKMSLCLPEPSGNIHGYQSCPNSL